MVVNHSARQLGTVKYSAFCYKQSAAISADFLSLCVVKQRVLITRQDDIDAIKVVIEKGGTGTNISYKIESG